MFTVLITDCHNKNAIALARHLKREMSDLELLGYSVKSSTLGKLYGCYDGFLEKLSLESAIADRKLDMVIPVGGISVLRVAEVCPHLAVLPALDRLEICYDKAKTTELARGLGIPVPRTAVVNDLSQPLPADILFPCVVKPGREGTVFKGVDYCTGPEELQRALVRQLTCLKSEQTGVLVQEFIPGGGFGFFSLMDHGRPLRIFMHQRLREFPPSGGPSTAARAFFSERLRELGIRLLSALEWNGVAMVEFRRDSRTGDFVLMEVNGKFWGSLELGLCAGVRFGSDLVRLYRGEQLHYKDGYDRGCHFYWPLDDDILTLLRTRSLGKVRDYWRPEAHTNLGQSFWADAWKAARLVKRAVGL